MLKDVGPNVTFGSAATAVTARTEAARNRLRVLFTMPPLLERQQNENLAVARRERLERLADDRPRLVEAAPVDFHRH
jgi:hypothetical protein